MLHLLQRAFLLSDKVFLREFGGSQLTARQYEVLDVVSKTEGLSQSDIVERTGIDRSTTTDIARRLVRRGYLQRRRKASDARAYSVKLTGGGRQQLAAGHAAAERTEAAILEALPSKERERFRRDLLRIVQALSAPQKARGKSP